MASVAEHGRRLDQEAHDIQRSLKTGAPPAWEYATAKFIVRSRCGEEFIAEAKRILSDRGMDEFFAKADNYFDETRAAGNVDTARGEYRRELVMWLVYKGGKLPKENVGVVRSRRKLIAKKVRAAAKAIAEEPEMEKVKINQLVQFVVENADASIDTKARGQAADRAIRRTDQDGLNVASRISWSSPTVAEMLDALAVRLEKGQPLHIFDSEPPDFMPQPGRDGAQERLLMRNLETVFATFTGKPCTDLIAMAIEVAMHSESDTTIEPRDVGGRLRNTNRKRRPAA